MPQSRPLPVLPPGLPLDFFFPFSLGLQQPCVRDRGGGTRTPARFNPLPPAAPGSGPHPLPPSCPSFLLAASPTKLPSSVRSPAGCLPAWTPFRFHTETGEGTMKTVIKMNEPERAQPRHD